MAALRRDHRRALPLLAGAWSATRIEDADVVVCSTSNWAHGLRTSAPTLVYCHAPARWLYQSERYLGADRGLRRSALGLLRRPLLSWDQRAARRASRYIVNSSVVRDQVAAVYGRSASVVPPPPALGPAGERAALPGIEPGYLLTVSRLLPYKNVDALVEAMRVLPDERLLVAGDGPLEARLRDSAPASVTFLGRVDDPTLRALYAGCAALVCASYEDFGLTPLEAAGFGKPTVALRAGGYLDTIVPEVTGVLVDSPAPSALAAGVRAMRARPWDPDAIHSRAAEFGPERFVARLRELAAETAAGGREVGACAG